MKKIIINTVIILIFSILTMYNSIVSADDIPRSKCEMTIKSSHTMDFPANATKECNGLVFGFYSKEQDAFRTFGMTNYDVTNGQQLIMGTPAGTYTEAILTVYTVKEAPKPEPEEPKEETKPTQPVEQPKEEPEKETPKQESKPSSEEPKEEPKEESKPSQQVEKPKVEPKKTTQPKTETKTQDTSVNIVEKTEETEKPVTSKSSETEQDTKSETIKTTENVEDEEVKPSEDEAEEVASVSTEITTKTESDFPVLLTFVIGIVFIGLAGLGVWWFKFRKMKS